MRYSVVVFDRKVFRTMKEAYQHVTIDDYISIILIDQNILFENSISDGLLTFILHSLDCMTVD